MERSVLILGGSGLVGSAVVRALLANSFLSFPVVVVDRREPEGGRIDGVVYEIGMHDIFDAACIHAFAHTYNVCAVIDCVPDATIAAGADTLEDMVRKLYHLVFEVTRPLVQQGVVWVDIGTVGTGGMGEEIGFTHGDVANGGRVSRGLIYKSGAAGMHGSWLDLLGRSRGFRCGRVVPRGMIGWGEVKHGPITVSGKHALEVHSSFVDADAPSSVTFRVHGPLQGVGIRMGENGEFARSGTVAISTIGQMEAVNAEAVAEAALDVLFRLFSHSGTYFCRDVHPDQTAFASRRRVLMEMDQLQSQHPDVPGVSWGNLGPYLGTELWALWVLGALGFTPRSLKNASVQDVLREIDGRPDILGTLCKVVPGLGYAVLRDDAFAPRYTHEVHLTSSEVRDQLTRARLLRNHHDHLWSVDLRGEAIQRWIDTAALVDVSHAQLAENGMLRSHLPLRMDQPLHPGSFWAACTTVRGHARTDYALGARYS